MMFKYELGQKVLINMNGRKYEGIVEKRSLCMTGPEKDKLWGLSKKPKGKLEIQKTKFEFYEKYLVLNNVSGKLTNSKDWFDVDVLEPESTLPRFKIGKFVSHTENPSKSGVVVEIIESLENLGVFEYKVECLSPDRTKWFVSTEQYLGELYIIE